ncbi:DUF4007 family protein [Aliivibrio fischeri]|uniref:DUF4007 family protein n=1 Tax=Aliivibrio fischeri TaxID=668 RepID=A0A510UMP9_ALIFS|nr:DUF4007 family protein [Aliivibrio fischeri]GEK14721.1 hypothetical protein AFI02nite_27570 [Aliivibrio fischeri]
MIFKMLTKSLPLSFTQDFKPERRLISQLLLFTQKIGLGDKQEISDATGIPTGKSTGKVEPTIHYATAMGLINADKEAGQWVLSLTPLGQLVWEEDPYFSEEITLWLMHLMLCRPLNQANTATPAVGIVDSWFTLFSLSETRLGRTFTSSEYGAFMEERFGVTDTRRKMCTVILGSYKEDSCLGLTKAIQVDDSGCIVRKKAPQDVSFYPVYSAYLFLLWDEFFPNEKQLSLNELFQCTRMLSIMFWTEQDVKPWLDWMADNGMMQLDRQTGESLALRTIHTMDAIEGIFSELL